MTDRGGSWEISSAALFHVLEEEDGVRGDASGAAWSMPRGTWAGLIRDGGEYTGYILYFLVTKKCITIYTFLYVL